jgi:hypothetical protein
MAIGTGQGATVAFTTSAFAASLMGLTYLNPTRGVVETTHLATSALKTFIPSPLADGGEFSLRVQWDPAVHHAHGQIVAAAETITITWPDTETSAFTGFCTAISPVEVVAGGAGLMEATFTYKQTGALPT